MEPSLIDIRDLVCAPTISNDNAKQFITLFSDIAGQSYLKAHTPDEIQQIVSTVLIKLRLAYSLIWNKDYSRIIGSTLDTTDQLIWTLNHLETISSDTDHVIWWEDAELVSQLTNLLTVDNTVTYIPYTGDLLDMDTIQSTLPVFRVTPPEYTTPTHSLMRKTDLRQDLITNKIIDQFRYIKDVEEIESTLLVYLTTDVEQQQLYHQRPSIYDSSIFDIITIEPSGNIRNAQTFTHEPGVTDTDKYEREGRNLQHINLNHSPLDRALNNL